MWEGIWWQLTLTVLAVILLRCDGGGGESEYDYSEERVVDRIPVFTTQPQKKLVNEGSPIRLPCFVDRLEGFVLLWKQGETILAVGERVINFIDTRTSIQAEREGNWLVVQGAQPSDAGEYTCHISAFQPKEVVHSVLIRTRPAIKASSREVGGVEGGNATLACIIKSGSPTPAVTWSRAHSKRWPATAGSTPEGPNITLVNITRHFAGTYRCKADNGYNEEGAVAEVRLTVEHKPYIEQTDLFVQAGRDERVELSCLVHALPPAQVAWFRGSTLLSSTQYNITQSKANMYKLTLQADEAILGNYSCEATNSLGTAVKSMLLSNQVGPVKFTSLAVGNMSEEYRLEWVGRSAYNVTLFHLLVTSFAADATVAEVEVQPDEHSGLNWSGSYELTGLSPASLYLATVAGVNQHGRGPPSHPPFIFGTRGARLEDAERLPTQEAAAGAISLTRCWPWAWAIVFLSLFLHLY